MLSELNILQKKLENEGDLISAAYLQTVIDRVASRPQTRSSPSEFLADHSERISRIDTPSQLSA